jgi:hypothetical protein
MTFKALSNIIKKYKERPTQLARQQEQEITEAQAIINTLRANHHKAYHEREAKWEKVHPGKRFYERSEEDNRKDCTLDEWYWDFFTRIFGKTPEQRYQQEKNPDHGFGHKSKVHERSDGRLDKGRCITGCRFYEPTGTLTVFDILEDYHGYQKFEDVWQAYKELEVERSLPPS